MDKDTVTYVVTDSKELTHRVRADRGFSVITNGVLELYRDGHIVACFNSDSWLSVVEES